MHGLSSVVYIKKGAHFN